MKVGYQHIKISLPEAKRQSGFFRHVQANIYANIDNHQFDVQMLARLVCLSVSQLNRKLNANDKCSAGQLIRETRLKYAAQLLLNDEHSISEIAFTIGYTNQANFCRSFKRRFGCAPSKYLSSNAQK